MRNTWLKLVVVLFFVSTTWTYAGTQEDYNRAVGYYNEGKIAEALALFNKVEKKQSKKPEVKYYIALCLIKQQNWDGAIQKSEAALKLNPSFIKAYLAKANAQIGKGAKDEALATLEQGLTVAPENMDLWYLKGILLYNKQDYPGAIETFNKVITSIPDKAYAHYYLGLSNYNAGKKPQAIQSFERFLQLAPEAPEAPQIRELLRRLKG